MSNFSIRVINIVSKIPRGETLTYKQVAIIAKSPNAYRAVGNILNNNHNSSIPCHRVIRSDGRLGGYNKGEKNKFSLLKMEGAIDRL